MEQIEQFGVEPVLLVAQIVNFIVLLLILKRFLYKPVLDMLKKREEKIRDGLEAGQKGEALLARAKEEEKALLAKAGVEAKTLLEQSKERAAKLEQEALEKTRKEVDEMILAGRAQIEKESQAAEAALEQKTLAVAVGVLERILPKVLSKQDQTRIIASSEKMLKKVLPS